MNKETIGNRIAWLCILILILIATRPIVFFPRDPAALLIETISGHEYDYNLWRMLGMADALFEGLPGRWLQAFSHGWGYPLFHYTGPLPYVIGGLLVLFGFEPHAALNLCWIAAYAGAGVAMFWAMRPFLGRWGAVLAGCCYLLAPYHLVDTYVRTNLPETTAFIFPPLILAALMRARINGTPIPSIAVGSLAVMLLALTHFLSFYIIGLSLGIFCLVYLPLLPTWQQKKALIIPALTIAGIGTSLSAFFWLPAITGLSAVKGVEALTSIHYHEHFVYFPQLFSHVWEYGGSEPGPRDYMSFSIGPVILVFALCALGVGLYRLPREKSLGRAGGDITHAPAFDLPRFVIAAFISAAATAFLTLNLSSGLWKLIPGMETVQFPWRFLLPASAFLALAAGALPQLLAGLNDRLRNREFPIALVLSLIVLGLHWNFVRPASYDHLEKEQMSRNGTIERGVWTTSALEFLPRGVLQQPYRETMREQIAVFHDENLVPRQRILKENMGSGTAGITLMPGEAGTVILNQHWHPAWRASIDGESIDTFAYPWHPFAPVAVAVTQDSRHIEFRYSYTAAGYFGIVLSMTTVLGVLGYLLRRRTLFETRVIPVAAFFLVPLLIWQLSASIPRAPTLAELVDSIERKVSSSELVNFTPEGGYWDSPGNVIFGEDGLRVNFGQTVHKTGIGLSLDSNDQYEVFYLNNGEVLGRGLIPKRNMNGMSNFTHAVPEQAVTRGYDSIALFPIEGDGSYSLGHIHISNDLDVSQSAHTAVSAPDLRSLPIEQVSERKEQGSWWDVPGNQVLQRDSPLRLTLNGVHHTSRLELSVDNNDFYFVKYLLGGNFMGGHMIHPSEGHGLAVHLLDVPAKARGQGFDAIEIMALAGDENYSLGHMILQD
jgi:hypothetical protein